MVTVPLAVFGALAALLALGYSLNIYTQIHHHADRSRRQERDIIVEFANQRRDAGLPFETALVEAAQVRLRPILMTSIATVLGVLPLVFHMAPAPKHARISVSWCAAACVATVLTLFMVPAFYSLLARRSGSPGRTAAELARQISLPRELQVVRTPT